VEHQDIAWSLALAAFAAHVKDADDVTRRRARIAATLRDPDALHLFAYRWDVFTAYGLRCERHPQIMARDPEFLDAALIELRASAELVPRTASSKLHRVLAELEGIAERTRPFRQQAAVAQKRVPANA
jgi:hypothetical protein